MSATPSNLGQWGEDLAETYLEKLGWEIECKNYHTPVGECDLLAWDGEALVFTEVKTRSSDEFGSPGTSVTEQKRDQIRRVARYFLARQDEWVPCRFDVIAIQLDGTETDLTHIRGAFESIE